MGLSLDVNGEFTLESQPSHSHLEESSEFSILSTKDKTNSANSDTAKTFSFAFKAILRKPKIQILIRRAPRLYQTSSISCFCFNRSFVRRSQEKRPGLRNMS